MPEGAADRPERPVVEVTGSRETEVGGQRVRRALPRRDRRTVGPWCFADHFGPAVVDDPDRGLSIGPHPHLGLHTVTWLLAGEAVHRDSLGTEQPLRPGQLNLMTAGHGVAHSEEPTGRYTGEVHGVQLWVAQPERTRHGPAAFEHHAALPQFEIGGGVGTVLIGEAGGVRSPARADTEMVGVDLDLNSKSSVNARSIALRHDFEHALVVTAGAVLVDDVLVTPGHLAYLGAGRDELVFDGAEPARALLLGGVPFESPIVMWWNFVGRTRDEVAAASAQWNDDDDRFGDVDSSLARIPAPVPPWRKDL